MGVNEFRANQSAVVAELGLLIIEVSEMDLDEDTKDLVIDRATTLIAKVNESVKEKELDRIRTDLGTLQSVVHHANRQAEGNRSSSSSRREVEKRTDRPF